MLRNSILKVLAAAVLTGASAAAVLAKPKPIYDVTGTWTGVSIVPKAPSASLSVTFTTSNAANTTFTGTLTVGSSNYDISGTATRGGTIKWEIPPAEVNGGVFFSGTFRATTNKMTGKWNARDYKNDRGTFSLTKE